jgi:hypothetical protein
MGVSYFVEKTEVQILKYQLSSQKFVDASKFVPSTRHPKIQPFPIHKELGICFPIYLA